MTVKIGKTQKQVRSGESLIALECFLLSDSSNEGNPDTTVTYDRLLPTTHSYMNVENFQEFSGVSLLSDDRRCLLHIVELANMILIPNQIVPWQVFNSRTSRMIKEAKQERRLFGVIDACSSLLNNEPKYGTTAEIVSYFEETNDNSLQLKIIGRQRFIIDNPSTMKRDLNGILRANVRILPDIHLRRPPLPMISQNFIHTINFVLQNDIYLQREKRLNQRYNDDNEEGATGCGQVLMNFIKRRRTTSSTSSTHSHDTKSNLDRFLPSKRRPHSISSRSGTCSSLSTASLPTTFAHVSVVSDPLPLLGCASV